MTGPSAVRVKVCGITRAADARCAVALGARWIGLIFTASPRRVTLRSARRITSALPSGVEAVGVFGDEPVEEVLAVAEAAGCRRIQLHGEETRPRAAREIRRAGFRVSRAVRLRSGRRVNWLAWRRAGADLFVVDARAILGRAPSARSRESAMRRVRDLSRRGYRVLLAGGLDASTVASAVVRARPFGVDVASGVEASPGRKDRKRLREFFAAVRSVATPRAHRS